MFQNLASLKKVRSGSAEDCAGVLTGTRNEESFPYENSPSGLLD